MRKKNILFIENSIGLSGSTISLCNILLNLDRTKYNPSVILSRPEQKSYLQRYIGIGAPTAVIRCGDPLKFKSWAQYLTAAAKRLNPHLIRPVYFFSALLDMPCVILPYLLRMYLFVRGREIDLIHHNNGFDVAAILLAKTLGKPIVAYQRGAEWNSFIVRYLCKSVDLYVANSETTKKNLLSLAIPGEKIKVVYPPVDHSRFDYQLECDGKREEFNLSDSTPCFGILGTLLEWKGHRVFLRAASQVFSVLPNSRAFIIGDVPDGSGQYKEELFSLTKELGIADKVIFTGFRNDVPELIKMLDVIVHTSVSFEPFGRVIIEAMAMKKPVVATSSGGPEEIIRDGHNGFLVAPFDDQKIAERVIQLLKNPGLAWKIGKRAYLDSKIKFSILSHIKLIEGVYENILEPSPRRPR
jgi:glycosyltransferase involved in cell wall biosynthesis